MYFDYKDQQNQTAEKVVRSLLKQLLSSLPLDGFPYEIEAAFEASNNGSTLTPDMSTLTEMFVTACGHFSAVFVMIDALDECNPEQLENVFSLIGAFRAAPSVKVFCSSRPHVARISEQFVGDAVLRILAHDCDLENYLSKRLGNEWKLSPHLKTEIKERLISRAEGM